MQLVDLCFSGRYTRKEVEALLFREGGLQAFLLRRAGAFSIYREGMDKHRIEPDSSFHAA